MGNMREKAKVLQPTVINGNGNDSEEYFFFLSLSPQLSSTLQFAVAAAISPSLETEFDDSLQRDRRGDQINFPITWPITLRENSIARLIFAE